MSSTLMQLAIDLGTLEPPGETVFANSCSLIDWGLNIEFVFSRARPKGLVSPLLSVIAPIDAVVVHFWGSTREYLKADQAAFKAAGIDIQEVVAAQGDVANLRVVSGNVFRIARSGIDATLELYYLPPYSTFLAGSKRKPLKFEPVIRIEMPAPLLTGIVMRVDSMVPELKARLGNLLGKFEAVSQHESTK